MRNLLRSTENCQNLRQKRKNKPADKEFSVNPLPDKKTTNKTSTTSVSSACASDPNVDVTSIDEKTLVFF